MAFRFSPRPNRAHEIPWREWGEEAFAAAAASGRPILLSLSAVWCHWCHVMDEVTYSDPEVQALIARHFVPVRVDTDERPDVNARYNLGGWPTTAFLNAAGEILTGGTFLPPPEMCRVLRQVAAFYAEHAAEVAHRRPEESAPPPPALADPDTVDRRLLAEADPRHGGFGTAPKFPQPEILDYVLTRLEAGDRRFGEHLRRTLAAMAEGGLWDREEGGFFRYATREDWEEPHTEKLLVDNARLMGVYARASRLWPEDRERLRGVALAVWDYVRRVLPLGGLYGASQDADEDDDARPSDLRRHARAPAVDPVPYAGPNAWLARELIRAGLFLREEAMTEAGVALFAEVVRRLRRGEHLRHGEGLALEDYLGDLVAFGQAAFAADLVGEAEGGAELRFVAETLVRRQEPSGVVRDRAEAGPGRLARGCVELPEQAEAAEVLLLADRRLGGYGAAAARLLEAVGGFVPTYGIHAAPYARAARLLAAETWEVSVGPGTAFPLAAAARTLPGRLVVRGSTPAPEGSVVLCSPRACSAPIRREEEIPLALEIGRHWLEGRLGRRFMGRVPEDVDLLAYLTEEARRLGVRQGVLTALGAVKRAQISYFDQAAKEYREIRREEGMEIASLVGNVSLKDGEPFVHAHVVFGDRTGAALAGHLAPGTVVFTAEYVLEEVEAEPLVRRLDPHFNLLLWGGPEGRV